MAAEDEIPNELDLLEVQKFSSNRLWAGVVLFGVVALISFGFLVTEYDETTHVRSHGDVVEWAWMVLLPLALGVLYIQLRGGIRIELFEHGLALHTQIRKPSYWAWANYGPFKIDTQVVRSRLPFISITLIRLCANKMTGGERSGTEPTWSTADISLSITGFPAGKDMKTAEAFLTRVNRARESDLANRGN